MFQPVQPVFAVLLYQCCIVIHLDGQYMTPPTEKEEAVTKPDLKSIFLKEVAKRYRDYNPNPGYEPYWPQGAWVFEDSDMKMYGSTTKMPLVCGQECNYLFRKVKKVCAKVVTEQGSVGCRPWLFFWCDGYYPDRLTGFRTFDTYCQFLDDQCHASTYYYWILVHVGPCLDQDAVFNPVYNAGYFFDRLDKYLSTLQEVFANASLPAPFGLTTVTTETATTT